LADKKPEGVDRLTGWLDSFQRRHCFIAFPYAVVKKYGDDEAGNRGALITYYGFLSIFPLLLVLTTILHIILRSEGELRERIMSSLDQYFPAFGNQLQSNINTFNKAGLALAVGIAVTLYGARGGAETFRKALNHIWEIPRQQRGGFPVTLVRSFSMIFVTGLGLIMATILSSFATSLGHSPAFSILAVVISTFILFLMFLILFNLAISTSKISYRDFLVGAILAAVGIQILQTFGGFIITNQLKDLRSLYGAFALVLGTLFWIYLQVQVILYAVEVDTVRRLKLWPRSLSGSLTEADKRAYKLYAEKERFQPEPPPEIKVRFKEK
jgi:YihY family inner membrane protein